MWRTDLSLAESLLPWILVVLVATVVLEEEEDCWNNNEGSCEAIASANVGGGVEVVGKRSGLPPMAPPAI